MQTPKDFKLLRKQLNFWVKSKEKLVLFHSVENIEQENHICWISFSLRICAKRKRIWTKSKLDSKLVQLSMLVPKGCGFGGKYFTVIRIQRSSCLLSSSTPKVLAPSMKSRTTIPKSFFWLYYFVHCWCTTVSDLLTKMCWTIYRW